VLGVRLEQMRERISAIDDDSNGNRSVFKKEKPSCYRGLMVAGVQVQELILGPKTPLDWSINSVVIAIVASSCRSFKFITVRCTL
jgi:hypothetical protein